MTDYTHFTVTPAIQVLATKSRDSTIPGHVLSQVHQKMGVFLGQHLVGLVGLEEIEFEHVQGIRKGPAFQSETTSSSFP